MPENVFALIYWKEHKITNSSFGVNNEPFRFPKEKHWQRGISSLPYTSLQDLPVTFDHICYKNVMSCIIILSSNDSCLSYLFFFVLFLYTDPDKERQVLEQTEQAFRNYAHHLNKEGGEAIRKKRPSLVALSKINFEYPRTAEQDKAHSHPKIQSLSQEKAKLTARVEALKRRVQVAKDRKIFFSMSSPNSHAFADAETEFHEAQLELAKAKKRLCEIETEFKNQKVLDLIHKAPERVPHSPTRVLQRKNSRECKLGPDPQRCPNVDPKSYNPEGVQAAKGSVLSQIKVCLGC